MHIQRLFEIVYLLLYRKKITAREFADRFEVSTRTIYRDIETLSAAGIPIYTTKGKDGGIQLLDTFILNRQLLNEQDQQMILSSLKGVATITDDQEHAILDRLRTFFRLQESDWIAMDLSDWSNRSRHVFEDLRDAIWMHRVVTFTYFASNGSQSNRQVYPLQLWFKEATWYLKAYCKEREAFRLFKLSRIQKLHLEAEVFTPMPYPEQTEDTRMNDDSSTITIRLWVDAHMAYRVYDEYIFETVECREDGSFLLTLTYPEDEWVYGTLLSFGPYAKVLSPPHVQKELQKRLKQTQELYADKEEIPVCTSSSITKQPHHDDPAAMPSHQGKGETL